MVYKTYAEGSELNTGDEIQADISEMDIIGSCTPVLVDYKNETVEKLFLSSAKRITYTIYALRVEAFPWVAFAATKKQGKTVVAKKRKNC